jgi:2-methylcitrate dehydratase PrpD
LAQANHPGPNDESLSERLAGVITAISYDSLTPEEIHRTKLLIMDTLGVALAAVSLDSTSAMSKVVTELGGPGEATVIGTGDRVPAPYAALADGALIHSIDYDDTHFPSQVHVCSSVVSAALAAAEATGQGGRAVIEAVVAGIEAAIRVGMAAPGRFNDEGFHATGVCGAFGATAAIGKILGLSTDQLSHALGLVGSQASGLLVFLSDAASWVKRVHPGWAAHSGYIAVKLAQAGFTGPRPVFEGRFGLYDSHVGDFDPAILTDDLGILQVMRVGVKAFPTGQLHIPFMSVTRTLMREHSLTADDIENIEARITPRAIETVCAPEDVKRRPVDGYSAKFSLQYGVAAMAVRGHAGLSEYTDEAVKDPAILAFADRVTYVPDETADFPRNVPAWIVVTLKDGTVLEAREPIHLGHPDNFLSDDLLDEKFFECTDPALGHERAVALRAAIMTLEVDASAADLVALTVVAAPAGSP